MYNRTIELYKGTDNPVELRFFNPDQKKVDVTGYVFSAAVMDPEEGYTIFNPDIVMVNATLGRAVITFTEEQLATLDAARYVVAIKGVKDGVQAPLYSDDNYGLSVELHINGGFLPVTDNAVIEPETGDYIVDGGSL